MENGSTFNAFTEAFIKTLETTSDILRQILNSPLGLIPVGLFLAVTMIKLFSLVFDYGYSSNSNYVLNTEDKKNTEDTEEEIILNDDLIQQELKCHNCGAKLNLKKNRNSIIECEYCNTQYLIKNEE